MLTSQVMSGARGITNHRRHELDRRPPIAPPVRRLHTAAGELTFFSTTTVFGTPVDVTLSELAIEAFFPANPETVDAMRALADALPAP